MTDNLFLKTLNGHKQSKTTDLDDASGWTLSGRISTDPRKPKRFYLFLPEPRTGCQQSRYSQLNAMGLMRPFYFLIF